MSTSGQYDQNWGAGGGFYQPRQPMPYAAPDAVGGSNANAQAGSSTIFAYEAPPIGHRSREASQQELQPLPLQLGFSPYRPQPGPSAQPQLAGPAPPQHQQQAYAPPRFPQDTLSGYQSRIAPPEDELEETVPPRNAYTHFAPPFPPHSARNSDSEFASRDGTSGFASDPGSTASHPMHVHLQTNPSYSAYAVPSPPLHHGATHSYGFPRAGQQHARPTGLVAGVDQGISNEDDDDKFQSRGQRVSQPNMQRAPMPTAYQPEEDFRARDTIKREPESQQNWSFDPNHAGQYSHAPAGWIASPDHSPRSQGLGLPSLQQQQQFHQQSMQQGLQYTSYDPQPRTGHSQVQPPQSYGQPPGNW